MRINPKRLPKGRIHISRTQRPIEVVKELGTGSVGADYLFIAHHHDWSAAQDIKHHRHCQPAEDYPKHVPGTSLSLVFNFSVHAGSFSVMVLFCMADGLPWSPEVPIHYEWLLQQRVPGDPEHGPIENLKNLIRRTAITNMQFVIRLFRCGKITEVRG